LRGERESFGDDDERATDLVADPVVVVKNEQQIWWPDLVAGIF
jgi:hypothetical protein